MSMNSQRLLTLVNSGDHASMVAAYNEYLSCHCEKPLFVRIYDSHTCKYRKIRIPCGRCYHCMESKINEWVTRMYAHCEDYKYVYFITLTYASFYQRNSPVSNLIIKKLGQAVWHYDNLNSLKKYCWRPCLLVKSHYQNFLKRLRKYTNNDSLTYVLCGETGSKFGAPHFHAILFSHVPIDSSDVKRAWSISLWKDSSGNWSYKTNQRTDGQQYNYLIGRIDFNDLVSNGTFNTTAKVKVDNSFLNAGRCFSYVCKYVCKQDSVNLSRVKLAFSNLWRKDTFVKVYDNEIPFNIVKDYLKDIGYPFTSDKRSYYNDSFLKEISYDKFVPYFSDCIFSEGIERTKKCKLFGHDVSVELFPQYISDFLKLYSPFVEFSRGIPIGSVYARNHLQEFKDGVFNKPLLQEKGFVVPRYFTRKADESFFGLRTIHSSVKSTSLCLGELPLLERHFKGSLEGDISSIRCLSPILYNSDVKKLLKDHKHAFADKSTGERILVTDSIAYHFKYDKHLRSYVSTRNIPFDVWLKYWLSHLETEFKRYFDKCHNSFMNLKNEDTAICIMEDSVNTQSIRDDYYARQSLYLDLKQFDYDNCHNSCE